MRQRSETHDTNSVHRLSERARRVRRRARGNREARQRMKEANSVEGSWAERASLSYLDTKLHNVRLSPCLTNPSSKYLCFPNLVVFKRSPFHENPTCCMVNRDVHYPAWARFSWFLLRGAEFKAKPGLKTEPCPARPGSD